VKQGEVLARGGPNLCPGHLEDVIYVQDKTRQVAIRLQEIDEEKRLSRALKRQMDMATQEVKEQNRVEREQDELAIILHNQKIREERKKRRQEATAARGPQRPAFEAPAIQGLGNQTLIKRAKWETNATTIERVVVGNPSDGQPRSKGIVEVSGVILKPGTKPLEPSGSAASVDAVQDAGLSDPVPERRSSFKLRRPLTVGTGYETVSFDLGETTIAQNNLNEVTSKPAKL
jgi:hypothetical protein